MKKYFFLASILAFMSCSSDDSSSNRGSEEPKPGIEVPKTKKNVLLVGYDAAADTDYLSQINPETGEVIEIKDLDASDFNHPEYDEQAKKLYDLTQDQIITLDFNTKKLTKKEFTPGFVVDPEGMPLLDGKGNLLFHFFRGYEFAGYSSFHKINLTTNINRIENGSQKLKALLNSFDRNVFNFQLNNKKDKLYAQVLERLDNDKAKFTLLVLNPNDIEDYDDNTEQKTIALPASFGSDQAGYGFFIDKDDNLIFITSDNRLVQFDLTTKKETELYKFENTYIGDLVYDKTTNNMYYLTVDSVKENENSKYTKLIIVNLGNRAKKTIDLKFKNQGVLELTSLVMVDPF